MGYRRGLRTGANLVTINLTPPDIRGDYLLYKRDRFIMTEERILSAIAAEGLAPSSPELRILSRGKARERCCPQIGNADHGEVTGRAATASLRGLPHNLGGQRGRGGGGGRWVQIF